MPSFLSYIVSVALLSSALAQSQGQGTLKSPDKLKFCKPDKDGKEPTVCSEEHDIVYNECMPIKDPYEWAGAGNFWSVAKTKASNLNTKCRMWEQDYCKSGFNSDRYDINYWIPQARVYKGYICYICDHDAEMGSCGKAPLCQKGCSDPKVFRA